MNYYLMCDVADDVYSKRQPGIDDMIDREESNEEQPNAEGDTEF